MHKIGMMTGTIYKYINDTKDALKTIKKAGFECADLTLLYPGKIQKILPLFENDDYKEKAYEIKKYIEDIKLPLVQAHAPFPVYKFNDDEYNKEMFSNLVKCIEISGIIGINNLVIHPFNDFSDEENIEFFNKLVPYAKENNVIICTENMWNWDNTNDKVVPCACSLDDSFKNVVNGVNSPYLKACVDIGHAEMFDYYNESARKMLEALNDDVYCLHIHDNDKVHDLHLPPFTSKINYFDVVQGLKNINYKYDFIIEEVVPENCSNLFKVKMFIRKNAKRLKKLRKMIEN